MLRVIVSGTRWAMKRAGWSSILVAVVILAVAGLAEAQQPKKVPRIGYSLLVLLQVFRAAPRHSAKVCASLVTSKEKPSLWSIVTRRDWPIRFPTSSRIWFVSTLMSSLRRVRQVPWLPEMGPKRSRSSLWLSPILLGPGLLSASRGRAGI